MTKLVNELLDIQRVSIRCIKRFACLAIEYSDKDSDMAEDFYKMSRQEEKKYKNVQSKIKELVNDDRLFSYVTEDIFKSFGDAKYVQKIYVGLKRELRRNDKGCTMEQETV